jgi:hypothetical protein
VKDLNQRRFDRIIGGGFALWILIPVLNMATAMLPGFSYDGALGRSVGVFIMGAFMLMLTVSNMDSTPTRRLPDGFERRSLSIMLDRLIAIASKGLPAGERRTAQQEIDAGAEQLTLMLGKNPWVAIKGHDKHAAEEHMDQRADDLRRYSHIGKKAEKIHGTGTREFTENLSVVLTTMVAVIRDFGLDPRNLAPGNRRLPGQNLGDPVPLPRLAAPVRTLAEDWLKGDNASVPPLERITADTAATTELAALETAWANARSSAEPEDVDAVDESFGRGVDRISAALSDAIALRARTDRDALDVNVRYLDAKHQDAA